MQDELDDIEMLNVLHRLSALAVTGMDIPGRRGRGRHKKSWYDRPNKLQSHVLILILT